MTWQILASRWLTQAALGGLIVLALGSVATRLCRQPVRKARLATLTLLCALIAPWIGALPIVPRWSAPILPAADVATPVVRPASVPSREAVVRNDVRVPSSSARVPAQATNKQATTSATKPALPAPLASSGPLVAPDAVRASFATVAISVLLSLYAAATAALVMWWLLGQAVLFRTCRLATPVSEETRSLFLSLAGPGGGRVRLLQSDRIGLPFTFTWSRPVILLPSSLCAEPDSDALRYCLAHEWSHVERRDSWAWNLASLASFALFYQPLFWWLRRQLRLCQDFLADDRAAGLGSPEDYAAYLVNLARCRIVGTSLPALGIGDRRSNLHRRIVMLVEDRPPLQRHCRMIWTAAAAVVASATVLVASGLRLDAATPQDPPKAGEKNAEEKKEAPKAETLNYSGVVKDKDTGKPIEGASVTVRRSILKPAGENRLLEETKHTTDAQGKYSFSIPPEQVAERSLYIELDVEHPDYATQAGFGYALGMIRKNETMGGRPFFESVELRPAKPITGRVQTPDGQPAKGVQILAYSVTTKKSNAADFEYGSFVKTKTDAEGKFRAALTTPGLAAFWIQPDDAAPEVHRVPDDKRGDLGLFVLKKGTPIKGRLLDAQGKPVAGAIVNAEPQRDDSSRDALEGMNVADSRGRAALTDADGYFAMAPLPAGEVVIQPNTYARAGGKDLGRRALSDVFVGQKLTIKEGEALEPIEVRAAPHVLIEAQYLDGKGKPTWGFESFVSGQIDGMFWHAEAKPDDKGKLVAKVPHGLENAQVMLMTNEHGALKFRLTKDGPLKSKRQIMLGTLDHDVKGIEIIHYKAPILVVKAVGKDGKPVKGVKVSADYVEADNNQGKMIMKNGVQTDVSFEEQEDGRHRSSQLEPDREVVVKAEADGLQPATAKVKLPEGETKEIVLILESK